MNEAYDCENQNKQIEFTLDMAQAVHVQSLDEDRRFVPDEVFETLEDAAETVEFLMGCCASGKGPLVYPVLLKDGTYIGYVQAVPFGDGAYEVGYHIGSSYTKQGYATPRPSPLFCLP